MQRIRKWSAPVLVGLWTLVLAHAAIPHVHAGEEAAHCCQHDRVLELNWVDSIWGWMHDWVHHHEESTVCDNLEDNFVSSPEAQILGLLPSGDDLPVKAIRIAPPLEPLRDVIGILASDPGHARRNGKRGP